MLSLLTGSQASNIGFLSGAALGLVATPIFQGIWNGFSKRQVREGSGVADKVTMSLHIDVLTATAHDLEVLLDEGATTSQELVHLYLGQIERHNNFGMRLNAVISTAPRDDLLERAASLDEERKTKGKRGPLHGIPIVLKDNICTPSLGMDTTCGSYALKGYKAKKDAAIVERLLKAGLLIIAKANLSEWANFKESFMTSGWSAVGGQTQSPYVRGGLLPGAPPLSHSAPAGSSSGSAHSVAAGFAPLAIGTESDGSLVGPSSRANLYAMKARTGAVPTEGCLAICPWMASNGAMAKSATDVANLMAVLLEAESFSTQLNESWEGLRVGFVDPKGWQGDNASFMEPNESYQVQMLELTENALAKIAARGAKVVKNAPLANLTQILEGSGVGDMGQLMRYQAREYFPKFLGLFEDSPVKTLEDLVEFNKQNANLELPKIHPGQQKIIGATNDKMTQEEFDHSSTYVRSSASSKVLNLLEEHGLDVIMGPSEFRIASVAAAAGFPVATMPLGFADFNGRPFGVTFLAPPNKEHVMLQVMSAWEATFPEAKRPPPQLVNWDSFVNGSSPVVKL